MDDRAFWLQLVVTVLIGVATIYYQRMAALQMKPKKKAFRHWPLVFIAALATTSWIPYLLRSDDLPEWPDPKPFIRGYSVLGNPPSCLVIVNGDRFLKYEKDYRIASACYGYDGFGDLLDIPQVQVSAASDIRKGDIHLRVQWSPSFIQYAQQKNFRAINEMVLLLPKGVDPGAFSSLRQAKSMAVKFVTAGTVAH
jgi:hypothetical protein